MYVDASSQYPRLSSVRTVGWAVADGQGNVCGGELPPGTSAAQGETLAIIEAYQQCEGTATIWSDCRAAVKLWRRCLKPGVKRYAGALHSLVPLLQDARRLLPAVQVMWIPSHKSEAEFTQAGYPRHAWAGSSVADQAAKQKARVGLAPEHLV